MKKRGFCLDKKCYLGPIKEQSMDNFIFFTCKGTISRPFLLHRWKSRTLWLSLFTLFRASWAHLATAKELPLTWDASEWLKDCSSLPFIFEWDKIGKFILWSIWKERNKWHSFIVNLEGRKQSGFQQCPFWVQWLKFLFIYTWWWWVKGTKTRQFKLSLQTMQHPDLSFAEIHGQKLDLSSSSSHKEMGR